MKVELRNKVVDGEVVPDLLILSTESEDESYLIDAIFGAKPVRADGLIGNPLQAQCRLSDGYGQHYISIKKGTDIV